jgi:hypothetical protein
VSQAEALQQMLEEKNIPLDRVFYIDVPQGEIAKRLGGRMVHPGSGRVYHQSFNPPKMPGKDDETGEDLIVREDDKPVCDDALHDCLRTRECRDEVRLMMVHILLLLVVVVVVLLLLLLLLLLL